MTKEMIISSTSHETRVAILEDDQVAEIFIEREHQRGVVGNLYKGRVSKVLPGMQSAFVDLGLERDGFLYVSDVIATFEEFDRLKAKEGLAGVATPVSDIGMIFLNDIEVMEDKNVRMAAAISIDKQAIVDKLLRGYATPIDTLEAPQYAAFDPSIKMPYDPEKAKELLKASGYSAENPAKFKIQTTRGLKPKDYEMVQAIVGMWRKVGIEAEIEVYEIAKHYELRASDTLAPAAFYNWGNAIGDPTTSTGFAMFGPSPHSVWNTDDLDGMSLQAWVTTGYMIMSTIATPIYGKLSDIFFK